MPGSMVDPLDPGYRCPTPGKAPYGPAFLDSAPVVATLLIFSYADDR